MSKRYKYGSILLLAITLGFSACVAPKSSLGKSSLELLGGTPTVYQCENGDQITARYYSLSDESLHFVKLTMPDGKQHTLPNVISASGARYTDDFSMVWWTKVDNAFSEIRNEDGKWQIKYRKCKESSS